MALRLIAALALWIGAVTGAGAADDVSAILARDEPPAGVVFELLETDGDALRHLIPEVTRHVEALRGRFPELPVAIVSHGNELFALQRTRADEFAELHGQVQQLTGDAGVNIHACGTYASWRGVEPADFPDYVDAPPSGPEQIREYEQLGYVRVRI